MDGTPTMKSTTMKMDAVPRDQRRARMSARITELERARASQLGLLRDLKKYMLPFRGRFDVQSQDQRGGRPDLAVINGAAQRSMSILSSGMMAGLTSPGRPWFKLTTQDPDLAEFTPVKQWLDDVARSMRAVFARSNLYNVLPSCYQEIAGFGTTALLELADSQSLIRFVPFTIGSYGIAQNDRLVVDTFTRSYKRTVRQIVDRFGTENLCESTRNLWRTGKLEVELTLNHIIEPNHGQQPGSFGPNGMPFTEEYWEATGGMDAPIGRSGYQERALFVPRWDVAGDDLWGMGIGHQILGDVKQLQFLERRKEDVLEKHTAPPLEAGIEMRGRRISLLSGDVSYTNPSQTGGAQIRPIMQTDPQAFRYAKEDISDIMLRIRQACFEDLFLMLANDTRSGITAREVEERHQEKMLVLGPVLERLNEELFDPIIDRTYAIMERASIGHWRGQMHGQGLLPEPPEELADTEIHVEYTSILAQAAKATNTRGIEAFGMFLTTLAQAKMIADQAGVGEKVNWDQAIDEYADAQGVPSRMINDDDTVAQMRQAKQQQQQMQQMAQMAPALKQGAEAAATMATTVPQEGNIGAALSAAGAGAGGPLGG